MTYLILYFPDGTDEIVELPEGEHPEDMRLKCGAIRVEYFGTKEEAEKHQRNEPKLQWR